MDTQPHENPDTTDTQAPGQAGCYTDLFLAEDVMSYEADCALAEQWDHW